MFAAFAAAGDPGVTWSAHTLPIAGGQLSYVQRSGSGPALVLIPGSFGDHHVYDDLAPLLDGELRLVVVELPGHGGSWPPAVDPTVEELGRDVLNVVDALKLEHWYVGGHSIGGMIAIELARQRPDQLLGVISMEGWTHFEVEKLAFGGNNNPTLTEEQAAKRAALRARVADKLTKEQMQSFAGAWKKWNGLEILQSTAVPILEIWGDRDHELPSRETMRIPERPNIALKWIAGAGHSLLIQRPREVADQINAFVAATASPPRVAPAGPPNSPE